MEITVVIQNRRCHLRALRDSGNVLRDPIHGRPVLVAETAALTALWDSETQKVVSSSLAAEEKMAQLYGKGNNFTLLPYQAVGNTHGLLLAVRSDYLQIGRRSIPHVLVALTDTNIGNGCHALWGGQEKGGEGFAATSTGDNSVLIAVDIAG